MRNRQEGERKRGCKASTSKSVQYLSMIFEHNRAPPPNLPVQLRESPLQIASVSSKPYQSLSEQPKMVKIVVPSHCSRYIVTASDLANYLRSHFGEGHDFNIEVF